VNLAALIYLIAKGAISSDGEKTIFRTRGILRGWPTGVRAYSKGVSPCCAASGPARLLIGLFAGCYTRIMLASGRQDLIPGHLHP
jgi:hypothetical protein